MVRVTRGADNIGERGRMSDIVPVGDKDSPAELRAGTKETRPKTVERP